MDYQKLRSEKELIKMQEAARHDWRADLAEEHPYVEICPAQNVEGEPKKDKAEKKAQVAKATKEVVKEARKDEVNMSADEKTMKRSAAAGLDPKDHMSAATRQRLSLSGRGVKKHRGVKEETEQVDEAAPAVAAGLKLAAPFLKKAASAGAMTLLRNLHGSSKPKELEVPAADSAKDESVSEMHIPMTTRETPEEKEMRAKAKARHDALYSRGSKEHAKAKQKPLRKGEVRRYNKETGAWESNKD